VFFFLVCLKVHSYTLFCKVKHYACDFNNAGQLTWSLHLKIPQYAKQLSETAKTENI